MAATPGQDSLYINIARIQRQLDRAEADLGVANAEDEEAWGLAQLSAAELRRRLRDANSHVGALKAELEALRAAAHQLETQAAKPCQKCITRELEGTEDGEKSYYPKRGPRQPLRAADTNAPKNNDAEVQALEAKQARLESVRA
jgi:hypothetical protein